MAEEFCPPGAERRSITEDRVRLMVAEALEAHEDKLTAHMDQRFSELQALIKSAFPDGDPHGHRMAHEAQIEQAQGWKKLKAEVVSKFLTGGLWAAGIWMLIQGWNGLVTAIQSGHLPTPK